MGPVTCMFMTKNTQLGWGGGVCPVMSYLYSTHLSKVHTRESFIYLTFLDMLLWLNEAQVG